MLNCAGAKSDFDYKNYRSAHGLLTVVGVFLTPGCLAVFGQDRAAFTPVITENDHQKNKISLSCIGVSVRQCESVSSVMG